MGTEGKGKSGLWSAGFQVSSGGWAQETADFRLSTGGGGGVGMGPCVF